MPFLEAHPPEDRDLLSRVARSRTLRRGDYLIRRGDQTSDVFRLQSGVLEVVDPTRVPELIVNRMSPGQVVGELAYVSDAPRSVDVRAGTDCELLVWDREVLQNVFREHPFISATFHQEVARLTAARLRRITDRAIAGTFAATQSVDADDDVVTWVARIVELIKEALPAHDKALRADPDSTEAKAAIRGTLDQLEATVHELFEAYTEPKVAAFAERELRQELQPYLVRSALADRALRRSRGRIGTVQILAQAMIDAPMGDGLAGQVIDRWMLDRPTFRALRMLQPELVRTVRRGIPDHRRSLVEVLNVGTGALVERLVASLDGCPSPVTLSVLDHSSLALALLADAAQVVNVVVQPRKVDLVSLAEGEHDLEGPEPDIMVLHHLLEVLPERLAVNLLTAARRRIASDGVLIVATLGPSTDRTFLDRVLGWPTIRRARSSVLELLGAAGFSSVTPVGTPGPGLLLVALGGAR